MRAGAAARDGRTAGARAGAAGSSPGTFQRGARFNDLRRALLAAPPAGADLLLLGEVDVGLGRSGNRCVARELAEALGMSYASPSVSYLALTDDFGDDLGRPREHPGAVGRGRPVALSHRARRKHRSPLEIRDKFLLLGEAARQEARLSWRRSSSPTGRWWWRPATSTRTPRPRSARAASLVASSTARRAQRVARAPVGGDFNSSTSTTLSSTCWRWHETSCNKPSQ